MTTSCRPPAAGAALSRPGTTPAAPVADGDREGMRFSPRRPALAERLPVLQLRLERQRAFRREQLDGPGPRRMTSAPHTDRGAAHHPTAPVREVEALVEQGARRALDDIELALARIRTGGYGRCSACGAGIDLAVLEAIPQTTLCLRCHPGQQRKR